jgi:hypothetical protein
MMAVALHFHVFAREALLDPVLDLCGIGHDCLP